MYNPRKAMDSLFVSRVRIKLLQYFFTHSGEPVHLRAAVRELKEEINAVRRELVRMEEIKLLKVDTRGNRKYYTLSSEGPFLEELRAIVLKTFGVGGEILKNIAKLGQIDFVMLLGNYIDPELKAANALDLVIIGEVDLNQLTPIISEQEKKLEREINYTVLSSQDFHLRKRRRDAFVTDLLLSPKVLVYGDSNSLLG